MFRSPNMNCHNYTGTSRTPILRTLYNIIVRKTFARSRISGWDTWFSIDVELVRKLSGESGLKKLHADVIGSLSTPAKPKTVDEALQALRDLQSGDLCLYAGSQAKGDVSAAIDILSQVQNKLMPARVASPSSFMQEFWALLPNFATAEVPDEKAKDDTKKLLMGQQAVDHMWRAIKMAPEDTLDQRDIDLL
eukprot:4398423-Amphidinium_carterae.1